MPNEQKDPPNKFLVQTAITVIAGFGFSMFLILIGLIVLVRFWVFENLLYNLFFLCFLSIGIIFNIASVKLTLHEYCESSHILPFVVCTPITLFWTILTAVVPFFKKNFFSRFGEVPLAVYYSEFYDGLGYDPKTATVHPFVKPYISENSFFGNTPLLVLLVIVAARKEIFKIYSNLSKFYIFFSKKN
jgi:hypothetical protein